MIRQVPLGEGPHAGEIGQLQLADIDLGVPRALADLGRRRLALRHVPGRDGHRRAFRSQCPRGFLPEAARGASDDGALAGEVDSRQHFVGRTFKAKAHVVSPVAR